MAHQAGQARRMTASHSQLRNSESQGPKNRQTNCNFFVRKWAPWKRSTLREARFEAQEMTLAKMETPYFLSFFILPRPRICAARLKKVANSSAGCPLDRSLVAVGLPAATSAAFCLGRRSLRGLNFCRFSVLVGCAHDACAAEQGQRCGNESKFLHCFRFTSFRFERIFGKAVHSLIA